MVISELIDLLNAYKQLNGDVDVYAQTFNDVGDVWPVGLQQEDIEYVDDHIYVPGWASHFVKGVVIG